MLKFKQQTYDLTEIRNDSSKLEEYVTDIDFEPTTVQEEGINYTGFNVTLEANTTYCLRLKINKRPVATGDLYLVYGSVGENSKASENQIFYYTPLQVIEGDDNTQIIDCTFTCLVSASAIILRATDVIGAVEVEVIKAESSLKKIENHFSDLVSGDNIVIKKLTARGNKNSTLILNDSIYSIPPSQVLSTFDGYDVYSFGLPFLGDTQDKDILILDYWYEEA